ncbi:hypothetical protein K438DRAFT_1784578 [Mycena galopus ATCC 62051]|nr:hypothetical protein K438DRAFT_1784578 [Mycena galopus ATCC 62051]
MDSKSCPLRPRTYKSRAPPKPGAAMERTQGQRTSRHRERLELVVDVSDGGVKRKGDPQIQGEKPPKKAKASKQETQKRKKKSVSGAKPGGNEIGRRLRPRRDK